MGYRKFANKAPVYFKTRLYMICKTSLVSAVVAQPGRALDLLRGEAEDRAVVSSNLTDGTSGIVISTSTFLVNSKEFLTISSYNRE